MTFVNQLHTGVRQVSVDNLGAGSVTVEPGADGETVEVSLNSLDDRLLDIVTVRQDRDHLRITLPRSFLSTSPVHLRMTVPAGLSYNIATGSADVTITADMARSRVTSGSGDISLTSAANVLGQTGSGDITIGRVSGEAARVSTGSGDLRIEEAWCPVSAKSGSGKVEVGAVHQSALQASSGSGDISVPSTTGAVDLRSASGSLTVGVADGLPAWLDLHSVSGRVRIALEASQEPAAGEPFVSVRARTASGEIAVYRA